VGEVTYGNIRTGSRLEFTVIGVAASLAARIESMCKPLEEPALLSAAFANCKPDQFISPGQHELKGTNEPQEIFALRSHPMNPISVRAIGEKSSGRSRTRCKIFNSESPNPNYRQKKAPIKSTIGAFRFNAWQ